MSRGPDPDLETDTGEDEPQPNRPPAIWPIGAPDDPLRPTGRLSAEDRDTVRLPWWRLVAQRIRGRRGQVAVHSDEEE